MRDIYAVPGEGQQTFCNARHAPSGAVLMPEGRPTPDHVCFDQGDATGLWGVDLEQVWEKEMAASDAEMPRYIEDLWDAIGISKAPTYVQQKHADKKALRANKP